MKKLLFILNLVLGLQSLTIAQNTLSLQFHHKLGNEDFALEKAAQNNLGQDFKVHRLEYYLSELAIVHDGGTITEIENLWILVDASEPTQIDLGSYAMDEVEALRFFVGVDPDHNHLDPASFPMDHPLAPKFPSMHWGWTAGYRFLALEGNGGAGFDQLFELHGLGDENYFKVNLPISAQANNGQIKLHVNADYTRALEDIGVASGVIVHGTNMEALQALENFRDYVFSPGETTTSSTALKKVQAFEIFPNPAIQGIVNLQLTRAELENPTIRVFNQLGQQVLVKALGLTQGQVTLELPQAGMYLICLYENEQLLQTKTIMAE